jgi:hypothetical protein
VVFTHYVVIVEYKLTDLIYLIDVLFSIVFIYFQLLLF